MSDLASPLDDPAEAGVDDIGDDQGYTLRLARDEGPGGVIQR